MPRKEDKTRRMIDELEERLRSYGLSPPKPVDWESYLKGFRDGWDDGVKASLKLVKMFFEMWYRMQSPVAKEGKQEVREPNVKSEKEGDEN